MKELKKLAQQLICKHDFEILETRIRGEFHKDILKCKKCNVIDEAEWVRTPKNIIYLNKSVVNQYQQRHKENRG